MAVLWIMSLYKSFSGSRPEIPAPHCMELYPSCTLDAFCQLHCLKGKLVLPSMWHYVCFKAAALPSWKIINYIITSPQSFSSQIILEAEILYTSYHACVCANVYTGGTGEQDLQLPSKGTWQLSLPWKEKINFYLFLLGHERWLLKAWCQDAEILICFSFFLLSSNVIFFLIARLGSIIWFKCFSLQNIHLKGRNASMWAQ